MPDRHGDAAESPIASHRWGSPVGEDLDEYFADVMVTCDGHEIVDRCFVSLEAVDGDGFSECGVSRTGHGMHRTDSDPSVLAKFSDQSVQLC